MCKDVINLISNIYPSVNLQWIKDSNNIKNMSKYFQTNMKILKTTAPIIKKNNKNNNKGKANNSK